MTTQLFHNVCLLGDVLQQVKFQSVLVSLNHDLQRKVLHSLAPMGKRANCSKPRVNADAEGRARQTAATEKSKKQKQRACILEELEDATFDTNVQRLQKACAAAVKQGHGMKRGAVYGALKVLTSMKQFYASDSECDNEFYIQEDSCTIDSAARPVRINSSLEEYIVGINYFMALRSIQSEARALSWSANQVIAKIISCTATELHIFFGVHGVHLQKHSISCQKMGANSSIIINNFV